MKRYHLLCVGGLVVALLWLASTDGLAARGPGLMIPQWSRFEQSFTSSIAYTNPVQQAELIVTFKSPLGVAHKVYGFWDGGKTWRVRFAPNSPGEWSWTTACTDAVNGGLHGRSGRFIATGAKDANVWAKHGPLRPSPDGRYLVHDDLTPFFWLGDTAWNGPLKATDAEWDAYLRVRAAQKFSAVQWVTTQWRAAPDGNREQQLAYTGKECIAINPTFFQKLDRKVDAMNRAGLLSVPVLLWAINGGSNPQINPGVSLPEDQAIRLARYMVARWQANAVVWILNGDGDYRGEKAEKWRRIGRGVFDGISHAPVTCHPGGGMWVRNEFINEAWYDICGYQSAHNVSEGNLRWITAGPAATDWAKPPIRPFISLEAPYENHVGSSNQVMNAEVVRRAHYWSLLNAPAVGIVYGGHGIWGWDDGTRPPVDHPRSGTPLPWQQALFMPGAKQMTILAETFKTVDFWRLRPAPEVLAVQPGKADPRRYISAARTEKKDVIFIYVPAERVVDVWLEALTTMPGSPKITWINPRTGEQRPAVALLTNVTCQIPTPDAGDWILLVTLEKK